MYKVFLSSKICNIAATYLEFCDEQRGQDPLLSENLKYVDPSFQILAQNNYQSYHFGITIFIPTYIILKVISENTIVMFVALKVRIVLILKTTLKRG